MSALIDLGAVALGGAVGAPARYLIDRWIRARSHGSLPAGIVAVNVIGSALLGIVVSSGTPTQPPDSSAYMLLGVGFCGALTTFSTFALDTVELYLAGQTRTALCNVALSLGLGLAAFMTSYALATALW